jgi:hypothetical protein
MLGAGFDFNVACHVRLLSKDGVVGSFRCCRGEAAGKGEVRRNKNEAGRRVSANPQSNKKRVTALFRPAAMQLS